MFLHLVFLLRFLTKHGIVMILNMGIGGKVWINTLR